MNPGRTHLARNTRTFLTAALLLTILDRTALPASAAAKVNAYKAQIELPTYPWTAVKHPYFRGTDKVNIYPYPMLDFLSRDKTNRTYRTVVLENEYLRITFLPELGGKIHEVIDKTIGKPMFYVNHVVKPGLIGQCGAWTSGGVEWNTGPQGHTVSCMQPVPVIILPPEKDGSQSVAIGETERIYGTRWTVVVTLRPGRSFIEERIRIYNPTETIRPYYFWNCTAAPNTPGFRFIYPMTLGCDHAGEKFFKWPIDNGKDLSRGTNYQDASSIFAWHCDQDFFGSYNDDLDHGVVSYANHYQLPGKKAWTWGQGGFGKMHQMDLTDDDLPYNEVQTGPLLTQAQVGRLDPCEAVEWKEWWYPVHGIGGFTFANKDVAVNATVEGTNLHLRIIGTGSWPGAEVEIPEGKGIGRLFAIPGKLSPSEVVDLRLPLLGASWGGVRLVVNTNVLARFGVSSKLPDREPPQKKPKPESASELVVAGWQEYLFAHYSEAEAQFRKALEKDSKSADARIGLAFLLLDRDHFKAGSEAEEAVASAPDNGLAHYVLAIALSRQGKPGDALEQAWSASLDPATAIAARALIGKLLIRPWGSREALPALSGPGPWETDVVCRDRQGFALLLGGETNRAIELAHANLEVEPLDMLSRSLLWLANSEQESLPLQNLIGGNAQSVVDLTAQIVELRQDEIEWQVLKTFYFDQVPPPLRDPLPGYWAAGLSTSDHGTAAALKDEARSLPAAGVFPYQFAGIDVLRRAAQSQPPDGKAALYLGHLSFHLGRHAEARDLWRVAAELGAEPVVAFRALGMAAKTLDGDPKTAREWLEKASQADPTDAIVARDLANVLFELADKTGSDSDKQQLWTSARDRLKTAFDQGKGRSDFVALRARAQNRLGDFAETARMLDAVRVTVWEGSHELHDLFEQAHFALGEAQLKAGHPAEALAEFNRALDYPANLATGKLETAREAHLQYQRGNALAALGRKQEAAAAWKLASNEPESKDARIIEARQKAKEALDKSEP